MKPSYAAIVAALTLPALSVGLCTAANANEIDFTLTDCNTSSGCSPQTGNNFGTVKITDAGTGIVNVDVDLAGNFTWAKTGLEAFTFNLSFSSPVPTLSNVTATNWTPTLGAPQTGFNTDGMGLQQYGLDFTGANNSVTANLDFTLTAAGLSTASFVQGGTSGDTGNKYFFLADICTRASGDCSSGSGSSTGLVGAAVGVPVPGPIVGAGLPGIIAACGGLLALGRRRRQRVA